MSTSFYPKENVQHFARLKDLALEQLKAFNNFDASVFKEGALTKRKRRLLRLR